MSHVPGIGRCPPAPRQQSHSRTLTHIDPDQLVEARVLIAFDGAAPPSVLQTFLQTIRLDVELVRLHSALRQDIERLQPRLVVLDCDDDCTNALNACRVLNTESKTAAIPIVFLSSSDDETDEIVAFKLGAWDYIAKPFKLKPVAQRLQSLMLRAGHPHFSPDVINGAGLKLHHLHNVVEIEGQEVQLTGTEFDILKLLVSHPGRPFHRREILTHCHGLWHKSSERCIDVHIRNLRGKLQHFDLVHTQRGVGYFLKSINGE